jgi:hypothetical protein
VRKEARNIAYYMIVYGTKISYNNVGAGYRNSCCHGVNIKDGYKRKTQY